ncbi:septum site-determining protein MinC [Moraxella haemolytica]|uniref:septum site-determining protein MinC n=1 Tax=Moraxella haemolytica TaxID=2904119 RepID=UPI00254306C4|nr:septum site-determining protein MinC [Moraxella sp. ZY171148]WII95538.1 septum site-determining protein MinC [Moraxella sp. ZY171148]
MSKAIQLFGKMLTFSRIKINTDNLGDIQKELTKTLQDSQITKNIPVMIDSDTDLDLDKLVELLWKLGVQPIGVVDGALNKQAKKLRLAILPTDGKRLDQLATTEKPKSQNTQSTNKADHPDLPDETISTQNLHEQLIRSGQSVHHFGGDLTILGGVNQGGEAITDSNLHIYGHGLGRLVAGATGDKDAHIFCQKFNPTLVAVAGTYCLSEDIPSELIGKAVKVSYDQEIGLVFNRLPD